MQLLVALIHGFILLPLDENVTTISDNLPARAGAQSGSGWQVVRGPPESDGDGARRAP